MQLLVKAGESSGSVARDMSVGVTARQAIAMFREVRVSLGRVITQTALPYMTPC